MESDLHSSLFSLVDSHLSKTSIKVNNVSGNEDNDIATSRAKLLNCGSVSETQVQRYLKNSDQKVPLPNLSEHESPITNVLAEQIANMLKAKEKRQNQEQKQKLEEEMRKMKLDDDQDYVIDLMQTLQTPYEASKKLPKAEELKSLSSSLESLLNQNFAGCDEEGHQNKIQIEPPLPCVTDMSYILTQKIKKGKCSPFGKVLTSRLRPVAAPYLKRNVYKNIVRFDFKTKLPCDLIKEKLRMPTVHKTYSCSIFDI